MRSTHNVVSIDTSTNNSQSDVVLFLNYNILVIVVNINNNNNNKQISVSPGRQWCNWEVWNLDRIPSLVEWTKQQQTNNNKQ